MSTKILENVKTPTVISKSTPITDVVKPKSSTESEIKLVIKEPPVIQSLNRIVNKKNECSFISRLNTLIFIILTVLYYYIYK